MNMRDCFKPPEKVRRLQGNILNDLSRTCKAPLLLIPCLAPERQNSRKSSAQNRMKTLKIQFENSTETGKKNHEEYSRTSAVLICQKKMERLRARRPQCQLRSQRGKGSVQLYPYVYLVANSCGRWSMTRSRHSCCGARSAASAALALYISYRPGYPAALFLGGDCPAFIRAA